tara:strand:- start:335 stop:472 length:138 start_codon:yes stop_codon:yes gene_type:complete
MDLNYFKKTKILDGGMGQELLAKDWFLKELYGLQAQYLTKNSINY